MPTLTGGDITDHLQNKAGIVSFLRWPLRVSLSLFMFYLTWHFDFFGKIEYSRKANETQKHVVQERHQMDEISRRAEEEKAKERTRIAETEKRLAEKSRQANEIRRKNEEEQPNISRSSSSTAQVTSVNQPLIKVGDIYIYESVDSDRPESSVTTKRTITSNSDKIIFSTINLNSVNAKTRNLYFNHEWNLIGTRNTDNSGFDYSPPLKYVDFPLYPNNSPYAEPCTGVRARKVAKAERRALR